MEGWPWHLFYRQLFSHVTLSFGCHKSFKCLSADRTMVFSVIGGHGPQFSHVTTPGQFLLRPVVFKKRAMPKTTSTCFFIRHQGRYQKIHVADIHYIEASKNYCRIVTATGTYLTLSPLRRFEELLPAGDFYRIHRAYIVALAWITAFDNRYVYGPDHKLPIGDNYRQSLPEQFVLIGPEKKAPARKVGVHKADVRHPTRVEG